MMIAFGYIKLLIEKISVLLINPYPTAGGYIKKMASRTVFKDKRGKQVLFCKMPLLFMKYLSTLEDEAVTVFNYFIEQVHYRDTLKIRASINEISYATGIDNKSKIKKAIVQLATCGWIEDVVKQMNQSNLYVINVEPHINDALLMKMSNETTARSLAMKKKGSKQRNEKGEFIKSPLVVNSTIPSCGVLPLDQ